MTWVIDDEVFRSDLTSTQKLVALALSSFVNRNGEAHAWPSVARLCSMTSLSRRSVQAATNQLEELGILIKQPTFSNYGSGTNIYQFQMGQFKTVPCEPPSPPCAPLAPPRAAPAPKLSNELSNKQKDISRSSDAGREVVRDTSWDLDPAFACAAFFGFPEGKSFIGISDKETFDRFWSAYPRKVGKPAAEKAWAKAVRSTPVETIMAGLSKYIAERQRDSRSKEDMLKFTAHPATWLNQERWNDSTGVIDDASF